MSNSPRINQDAKLNFLKRRAVASADEMRQQLALLEADAVRLELRPASEILDFLARMDALQSGLRTLRRDGSRHLHAEETRFQGLVDKVIGKRGLLLPQINQTENLSLATARPAEATATDQAWWFLDDLVAQDRAAFRRKVALIGGGLLAGLLLIIVLFNTVLKPDPEVVARFQLFENATGAIYEQQDYQAALNFVNEGLAIRPQDMELLLFKAVILRETNTNPAEIDLLLAQAEILALQASDVPLIQSRIYLRIDIPQQAIEFAQATIDLAPESPEAWLTLGQGHALMGHENEAMAALEQASQLAFDQGRDELYVTAKLNMAYISGDGGLADDSETFPTPLATPSP